MREVSAPIQIDGSYGEGGGALLRTVLSMATLTQQPVQISAIRGRTKFPGLNDEDLTILRALAAVCNAETAGAQVGSHEVTFRPRARIRPLKQRIEIAESAYGPGSASACLVLNTLLPLLSRSGAYSALEVPGETYGHGILTYDYFAHVTLGVFRRMGLYSYPDQVLAGFGRGARGDVHLEIEPSSIEGLQWSARGELVECRAIVTTAELSTDVGSRGAAHLSKLAADAQIPLIIEETHVKSKTTGAYVTLWAEFEKGWGGATAMGVKGLRMEAVCQQAFGTFLDWYKTDATLDAYLADQILMGAVIAQSDSVFTVPRLTERLLSMIWVVKQLLPIRITVKGSLDKPGAITIRK